MSIFRRKSPAETQFQALIERWAGFVRGTLRQIDHRLPEADLEELEQDVRLRLWQALKLENNFDKPASFIRKVVLSVSIDAARRRQVRGSDSVHVEIGGLQIADDLGTEALESKGELAVLLKRLQAESPDQYQALGLHLQGFSTTEVGQLLGWTEAKARNTIYRFLDDIRAKQDQKHDQQPPN
jgi:RNA polymerase sigma factor (sigma-70 family)